MTTPPANSGLCMARHYIKQKIAREQLEIEAARAEISRYELYIRNLQHSCRQRQQEREELFLRMMSSMSYRRFCTLMEIKP